MKAERDKRAAILDPEGEREAASVIGSIAGVSEIARSAFGDAELEGARVRVVAADAMLLQVEGV